MRSTVTLQVLPSEQIRHDLLRRRADELAVRYAIHTGVQPGVLDRGGLDVHSDQLEVSSAGDSHIFHPTGQTESDRASAAADVEQQRVLVEGQPVPDVPVEHLCDGGVHLEEGVGRHAEGQSEQPLLDEGLSLESDQRAVGAGHREPREARVERGDEQYI